MTNKTKATTMTMTATTLATLLLGVASHARAQAPSKPNAAADAARADIAKTLGFVP